MSVTTTPAHHASRREPHNNHETAVSPSSPPGSDGNIDCAIDRPPERASGANEQFIAHVLLQARQTAQMHHEADEARAIFRVAVAFAAELETTIPGFDRFRFIKAATGL